MNVEIALELIEAELAAELPAHMRAFARAHADHRPAPAAPEVARTPRALAIAREACADPSLAARGRALLRLVAPIVIESDPAVAALRARPRTWDGWRRLAAARDTVAREKLGGGALEVLHRLYGVARAGAGVSPELPGPVVGWHARDRAFDVDATWRELAQRHGAAGHVEVLRSEHAHPRAFVVEPRREVIVVVPSVVETPAARFAVLHELGHAVVALAIGLVPRVVDEAGAAFVARGVDSPLEPRARARRTALAAFLDRVERGIAEPTGDAPPWALWHDPGAQAAYVEAEHVASGLPGRFVQALKSQVE